MPTAPPKSPLHNFPLDFPKWASKSPVNANHRSRRSLDSAPPPDADDVNSPEAAEPQPQRQWNLRPRRPTPDAGKSSDYLPDSEALPKPSRLRAVADDSGRLKFSISLTKEEIEEDIYALTGSRPSRRPRKRPRNIQKQLDSVFPGLWLVGVSPESYRNQQDPPPKR